MSNTITIELCAEDRQRLDDLLCTCSLIAAALGAKPFPAGTPDFVQEPAQEPTAPQEVEHPADIVAPHGLPESAVEPEQPKYTKADILAKVQQLAHPGNPKRGQAKTIVQSYAGKVSDIPEDKYNEVMEKLIALEEV